MGDYDRNQSGFHDSLVTAPQPASPTLRSGSNGSSTLQRTQAGGGSLGGKTVKVDC